MKKKAGTLSQSPGSIHFLMIFLNHSTKLTGKQIEGYSSSLIATFMPKI
ncbi:MAG: hypothetical protein OEM26_04415 [Saprospiraceae bacterium]|nr:hypothetical protein [Saprospiraceae bacterium]